MHVDHRLHPDSRAWAEEAVRGAARLGADCRVLTVTPDTGAGRGVEAAAREARYAALAGCLGSGDWLLSGHHQDDQVETLLLNLLRGSGPDGLAAMPESRRFAGGWLVRPLLAVSRAIGETMIVVLGAGAAARMSLNPFEAMTTVTAKIVSQLTGDADFSSAVALVAFALGTTLFVVTLGLNVLALYIVRKYREQYE